MEQKSGRAAAQALVIRVDDVFDVEAARRLAHSLSGVAQAGDVRVDLTHARELTDLSVAVFAQSLGRGGPRVLIGGLRQHHLRLLRYLGVDSSVAAAV